MKQLICSLTLLLVTSIGALGQDLSGRYQATLDLGHDNQQAVLIIVEVEGSAVSGSIGPDEKHRIFFKAGSIHENTISFSAGGIDTVVKIVGSELTGTAAPPGAPTKWILTGTRLGDLTLGDHYPPLSNEDSASRSQQILALRDALHRQAPNAEELFWAKIQSDRYPLVEDMPGESNRSLVTFLWHGSTTTKNVMLERGRYTRFNPQQNLFAHIEGTQVWFKTLLLPSASRFQYAISENDPNATFPPGPEQRNERYDPLNPKHLPDDAHSPESSWYSFLELPSTPPQPWYVKHDDLPKYEEKDAELRSKILGEKRELKVYLPPGYSSGSNTYPTLYLFDGEDEDGLVFATWTLENLLAAHRIRPLLVVRIVNPSPAAREKELGCLPGFADFLSNELVSFIRSHYRVNSSPAETGIGGYSRGGLAAAYAVLQHPETFGLALVQSGAFWWEPAERTDLYVEPNWIANQFVGKPHLPIRFYLEAGLFEVDLQGAGGDILETTRTLRDVLRAKEYVVSYNEFAGDHDYINWRGTFADGLIALFGTSSKNAKGL
jgi:enterochelin esterase-like enzyme